MTDARLQIECRPGRDSGSARSAGDLGLGKQQVLRLAAQSLGVVSGQEVAQAVAADLTQAACLRVPDDERLCPAASQAAVVAARLLEALGIETEQLGGDDAHC